MWWLKGRMNRASYLPLLGLSLAFCVALVTLQKRGGFSEIILVMLAVPRLHDIGKSGWWAGGFFLAEVIITLISVWLLPLDAATIPLGLFVIVVFGLLIWLGTVPGQAGTNRYGESPAPGFSRGWWKKT
jgi:uncharacterized membrane protein YhaH (DUF805 family)